MREVMKVVVVAGRAVKKSCELQVHVGKDRSGFGGRFDSRRP